MIDHSVPIRYTVERRNDARDAFLSRGNGIRDKHIPPRGKEGGEGERWVTRQRFPKFQSRLARRVAGKSLALNPPLALIERFSDSSSNPESGPNSPPTVNNSQASPTAGGNAAAIQEVSVPTSDGDAKKESLTRSLIPILVDPLFLFFFSFFLSLFFVFRS